MKIDILAIDGLGVAAEAFRLSRDVDKRIGWHEILGFDAPVTEMASCVLAFHDFTIVEREIFASNRIHVMWARTSFVDNPQKYQLPMDLNHLVDPKSHIAMRSAMISGQVEGLHQDEWRVHLPVMALTSFVCRISFRDLIKMAKYFDYLGSKKIVIAERLRCVAEELKKICDLFTGDRDLTMMSWNAMTTAYFLHEGETREYMATGNGNMWTMGISMPMWLRAHFVRHRPLTFVDDFFVKFMMSPNIMNLTINDPVVMEIAASSGYWKALLSKRSCWLTQSTLKKIKDPWAAIIAQFDKNGEDLLPCSHGVCVQDKDARLRYERKDPGVVCPRWLRLNDIDRAPWQSQIDKALESRAPFWRSQ